MGPQSDDHQLIAAIADGVVGSGLLIMVLFPFALPALALIAILMVPLILAALAAVLLAGAAAIAVGCVRRLSAPRTPGRLR